IITAKQRPLFATGRVHLIAVSKRVDAGRAVPVVLLHAGTDLTKTRFVDAAVGSTVADIEHAITPDTETIVIFNLPALVKYNMDDDWVVLRMMHELRRLVEDPKFGREIAVIGVTGTSDEYRGVERVEGASTVPVRTTSSVVIVDPGPTPATIV